MFRTARFHRFHGCLSVVAAAAVTACGGGNGVVTTDDIVNVGSGAAPMALGTSPSATPTVQAAASKRASDPTNYVKVASEGESFTVADGSLVRYGAGTKWVSQVVSGSATCSDDFFGSVRMQGVTKECDVALAAAPAPAPAPDPVLALAPAPAPAPSAVSLTTPTTMAGPFIDNTKIPAANTNGYSTDRVRATAEIAPATDIGAFRTSCDFSHMAYDDPIVYPGQPGKSHLHTFFGNTATSATTTPDSLRTTGSSTCRGGTANRSAYWVPAIIDTGSGTPIRPTSGQFYYKQGYELSPSSSIKPMPAGLRMIAGNSLNSTESGSASFAFVCYTNGTESTRVSTRLPVCPAGTTDVLSLLNFPQCWDGVNLDSPDHKSHVSGVVQDQTAPFAKHCPADHPVPIPQISFNVWYPVGASGTASWRLSSDVYDASLPPGMSMHGDWYNGWNKDVSDTWGKNCVAASKDCHSHLLGDLREIY